jgi:molybdate transport system substrate-binding protein
MPLRSALVLLALAAFMALPAAAEPVKVFAAASLKNALDAVAAAWSAADASKSIVLTYAGSPALAKQIEQGAPADVFISADLDWMDYLDGKGLVKAETRKAFLGNALVLIAPKDSLAAIELKPGADLAGAISEGKLAVADLKSVPAGRYAEAALETLGLFAAVESKLVQAANVRVALALVARGEATLGIVYATDAEAEPGVKVLAAFPEETHPPIVYPVAIVAGSSNTDAEAFVAFPSSPEAAKIFAAQGFRLLK